MIRASTLAVLCLLSGRAFSQGYDQDTLPPDRPVAPQLNPQGRSPNERPWAQHAYWIWFDAEGWHIRATTAGQTHRFTGSVEAPDGMQDLRALDPNLPIPRTATGFQFDVAVSGGEQGVDWRPVGSGCVRFNLAIDGYPRPGNVKIGYAETRPHGREPFELCPGAAPAPAPEPVAEETYQGAQGPEMDPEAFRPVLNPYGQWIWVPGYGQVWQPYASVVGPSFVPYTNGSWTYSDAGWVFASSYPWGWAPFHYGNWVYADAGWCWIPGRVWAPAWVDWRYGNGYVGWYPLAPVGYTGVTVVRQPVYSYVPVNSFTSSNVGTHMVTPVQAAEIHGQTHPVTSAGYVGGHAVVPVNAGPPVAGVSAAIGHSITPVPVHQVSTASPVLPPPSQAGVHYVAGASATHPVVTAPVAVARPGATAGGIHPASSGGSISPAGGAGGGHSIAPVPAGGTGHPYPTSGGHDIEVGPGHQDHESATGAAHEGGQMHGGGQVNPAAGGMHQVSPAVGNPSHGGGGSRPGAPPQAESVGGHGDARPGAPTSKPAPPPKPKMPPASAKPAPHPVTPAPPHKPEH